MVELADLWLPILLAAVFVFIVSSVIHMALPIHKGDYKKLPGEEAIAEAMRGQSVSPGQYVVPCPTSMKDMGTPEMLEKYKAGPVAFISVLPNGPPAMGKSLVQWFIFCIVIGVFCGYIGSMVLVAGEEYMVVFRVTGTVAILGYAFSAIHDSMWKGVSWSVAFKFMGDGIAYALTTAGTFAWLWPAAA